MEISVLILSCVILGLNPVLPVLLYFLISRFVTLYGFYQIKYIHTSNHPNGNGTVVEVHLCTIRRVNMHKINSLL